jgi:hypothetical protein
MTVISAINWAALAFGPVILAHLGLVGKYKTYSVRKVQAEPAKKGEKP